MEATKPRKKYTRKKVVFENLKDDTERYAPTKVSRRKVVFETDELVLRTYAEQLDPVTRVDFLKARGLDTAL